MSFQAAECDVALVSTPWAPPLEPSLGLGILKACLNRASISARVFHLSPELLRWTTIDTYQFLADSWGLNEFIFTGLLDPTLDERQMAAVVERTLLYASAGRTYEAYPTPESILDLIMSVRHDVVPGFLNEAAHQILDSGPKLVGFSCLFDQTMASLALATILKRLDPSTIVVFGGYALEGAPGRTVVQAFPCVDHLVMGDGEQAIVELARWALTSHDPRPTRVIQAPKFSLNDSPVPDYDDWYRDLSFLEAEHHVGIETEVLPVESSRGCWWGQSKHCVFCGIDDETLQYRSKDPQLTLDMLHQLRDRYGDVTFRFSDYIMPKTYYTSLIPSLKEQRPKFRLHSEIKANQPPERVRLLAEAGFVAVQPGIESFSTPVLREMDKGVRGIDNVCLLKSGYAERLVIYYNILYGLPGDKVDSYEAMLQQLPRLYHLMPPVSRTETVVTRFAPLQSTPDRFGLTTRPVHHGCYDVLFSGAFLEMTGLSLDDYAYYFERNFEYSAELQAAYANLVIQVDHWKGLHRKRFVELSYENTGGQLHITDSRFSEGETYDLSPPASAMMLAIGGRPVNIHRLDREVNHEAARPGTSPVGSALAELHQQRLVWQEGDLVLGLAIPKDISDSHQESGWPKEWESIYV